jgi:uncharacterized membrane protein
MMPPVLRKFSLAFHILFSVGWFGAVVAYLCIVVVSSSTLREKAGAGAYLLIDTLLRFVIIPMNFGALITGIVQSLGTNWGLFRYYWVVTKLGLTVVGTLILLKHSQTVSKAALLASSPEVETLRPQLMVHAVGGLVLLVVVTAISVFKPWGLIPKAKN